MNTPLSRKCAFDVGVRVGVRVAALGQAPVLSVTALLMLLVMATPAFAADYPVCPSTPTAETSIASLVATPYTSPATALQGMQCLDVGLRARRDRRAIFAGQYVRTTVEVATAIERGEFRDAAWTGRYLVAFANLYRKAMADYEARRFLQMSQAWRIAFDTSSSGDALVLQELLLGISAHINGDLPLALQEVQLEPNRADKQADHNTINGVLQRIVDADMRALSDLYAPGVAELPTPLLNMAEDVFYFGMASARSKAWSNAVVLWDVRNWPPSAFLQKASIANRAVVGAYSILTPGLSPALIETLRGIERSQGVWPNP